MSRDLDKKVSQKKFILSTFKKEIMDFMKFIIKILPEFHELKTLKNILDLMCKFNTVKLLNIWCTYIALPYKDLIIKGDFNYFENKNYKNDVVDLGEEQANYILQTYDKMRTKISKVSKDDKNKAMKFIQRLSAMSVKYYN